MANPSLSGVSIRLSRGVGSWLATMNLATDTRKEQASTEEVLDQDRQTFVDSRRSPLEMLRHFFFATSDGKAEALVRIGYAVVLMLDLLSQYGKIDLLYSNQGLHIGSPVDGFYSPLLVRVCYFSWIAMLLLLALGCYARWASIFNYAFIFYFFILRGVFVGHGADWVYHSMGFYLMFMTTDRHFALVKNAAAGWGNTHAIWPLRLAQINFLFIYVGAGVAKIVDPAWLDGSVVELVFRHPLLTYRSASWMAASTSLLALVTYLTIAWQLLAPLALVSRRIRVLYVAFALGFHLMIALSMRVGWFSEIMIVSTLLFWGDFQAFRQKHRGTLADEPRDVACLPLTKCFLVIHLTSFFLTQAYFVNVAPEEPIVQLELSRRGQRTAEIAGIYSIQITGNRPYDLVPSRYVEHVRFVAFEVVDRDGQRRFLSPLDSEGNFAPPWHEVKEIRRNLANLKLATQASHPRIWESYLRYGVMPEIERLALAYPVRINAYGVNSPVKEVPQPFSIQTVEKVFIFSATVESAEGPLEMKLPKVPHRHP